MDCHGHLWRRNIWNHLSFPYPFLTTLTTIQWLKTSHRGANRILPILDFGWHSPITPVLILSYSWLETLIFLLTHFVIALCLKGTHASQYQQLEYVLIGTTLWFKKSLSQVHTIYSYLCRQQVWSAMRNITSLLPEFLNQSTFPPKSSHHLRILLLLLMTKMEGTDEHLLIVDIEVSCWHDQQYLSEVVIKDHGIV